MAITAAAPGDTCGRIAIMRLDGVAVPVAIGTSGGFVDAGSQRQTVRARRVIRRCLWMAATAIHGLDSAVVIRMLRGEICVATDTGVVFVNGCLQQGIVYKDGNLPARCSIGTRKRLVRVALQTFFVGDDISAAGPRQREQSGQKVGVA